MRHKARAGRGVLAALVCAGLVGCDAAPSALAPLTLRNPTAPLAGTARFDADRFAGKWFALSCIGPCATEVTYGVSQTGGITRADAAGLRSYTAPQPGVLRSTTDDEVLVVMWVDEGFRTAAIGTASGSRAVILDRSRKGSPDRTKAAREVLDFNGWDIRQTRAPQ